MIHVCDYSGVVVLWVTFLFMYNGPLKGKFSSFTSYCINNYLTHLLLIPHTIQYCLSYEFYEVLGIWKDLVWYCWLLFLCWYCWLVFLCWCSLLVFLRMCLSLFVTFWCWNLLPKFLLTMGSIVEWYGVMSVSAISRVSKISSILGVNVMDICCICYG